MNLAQEIIKLIARIVKLERSQPPVLQFKNKGEGINIPNITVERSYYLYRNIKQKPSKWSKKSTAGTPDTLHMEHSWKRFIIVKGRDSKNRVTPLKFSFVDDNLILQDNYKLKDNSNEGIITEVLKGLSLYNFIKERFVNIPNCRFVRQSGRRSWCRRMNFAICDNTKFKNPSIFIGRLNTGQYYAPVLSLHPE